MRKVLTTPPAIEPVDLDETKLYCRISITNDDDLISALIVSARQYVEHYLQRALITQTWTYFFDGSEEIFDKRYVRLSIQPIISITSVKTYSDANVASVFPNTSYRISGDRIVLNDLYEWPTDYRISDSSEFVIVAGYGAAKTDVPNSIRLAIKMLVAQWYETRQALFDPSDAGNNYGVVPFGVTALLASYRNYLI